jgi:hypothetical protein
VVNGRRKRATDVQGISGRTAIEVERTLLSVQRWSLDDEAWLQYGAP